MEPREDEGSSASFRIWFLVTLINAFSSKGLGGVDLVRRPHRRQGPLQRLRRPHSEPQRRLHHKARPGLRQRRQPERFDNAYFVDLRNRQGVLTSDQGLANDGRTSWLVNGFADNQGWFFGQFAASMEKMSKLSASSGGGEIRRNCFRRNSLGIIIQHGTDDLQASA
ncbi:hypothetical protein HU200_035592 [Digitaria exilis]|uniref:Plant heme peroxidase family profile domain-containing protein n=1 Tax=Digitaria exilis TaxID=1010633 RepID=A0A835BHN8_9POAL|nr:hypothetical protein HU200_035592 [Digitaria exilis]